jgi:hypothetical protein
MITTIAMTDVVVVEVDGPELPVVKSWLINRQVWYRHLEKSKIVIILNQHNPELKAFNETFLNPPKSNDGPFNYWKPSDVQIAEREGWTLTNDSEDRVTISRLDEVEIFEDDLKANQHVLDKAMRGSRLHLKAVFLQGYRVNEPLQIEPP